MNQLICYKTMPEWDARSLPQGFRRKHNTKAGTWAKLTILSGKLRYDALDEAGNVLESFVFDKDSDTPFVQPQAWHKVEPLTDDLCCQLAFYCQPVDYYAKKYSLSAPHSEVVAFIDEFGGSFDTRVSKTALDVGCGSGRNTLFLQQHGFNVTAFDKNPASIDKLQSIIATERLSNTPHNIDAFVADASQVELAAKYNLIINTVMLMFLPAEQVPQVIQTMQNRTKAGGYNLIVCATDSADHPLAGHQPKLPFGFGFQPNELANYYQNWQIIKYNEDVGHLHRKDAHGNPIALRFATLLAKR